MHPQQCPQTDGFRPCEGWAPGSSTNPTQTPGDVSTQTKAIAFPRDVGLKATVRPLDDYSNTYIGLHSMDPAIGSGHYKYGEFQYVCQPEQIAAKEWCPLCRRAGFAAMKDGAVEHEAKRRQYEDAGTARSPLLKRTFDDRSSNAIFLGCFQCTHMGCAAL